MSEYTAVVDRFEEEMAVLLCERDGEIVDELVVARAALPADACQQDAVLRVIVESGKPVEMDYDPEATERRAERAQSRFDRLSERPPEDDSESSE